MAKTDKTIELERNIYRATVFGKMGIFGCHEVTIGWYGKERVDYMTYDSKGVFRCYEIKVSKADFYSKAHNTFVGHYNYYVMPKELYEQVKNDIPKHIGVYLDSGWYCEKRAKKQELSVDADILKDSMIRSLHYNASRILADRSPTRLEQEIKARKRAEKNANSYNKRYRELYDEVIQRFGWDWEDEPVIYSKRGRPI